MQRSSCTTWKGTGTLMLEQFVTLATPIPMLTQVENQGWDFVVIVMAAIQETENEKDY